MQAHEQVGELRLAVRAPRGVLLLPLEVGEVDRRRLRGDARHRRDTRRAPLQQRRQEQVRQDERAEEVAAPLQFVAVLRQHALRGRHDAGVVDEDVEPLAVAADLDGEGVGRNVEAALRRVVQPHPLGWVCPRPPGMREARRARAPCS